VTISTFATKEVYITYNYVKRGAGLAVLRCVCAALKSALHTDLLPVSQVGLAILS
jgi:hypothetical protein